MAVSFLASDLGKWDQLESAPETLVLPFFSDERPLRGAAGLCDWRLCGRLSRLLQAGRVGGQLGETTLYPPGKRLPFARLLLVGLGAADRFDEAAAKKASAVIADRMRRLTPRPLRAGAAGPFDGPALGATGARDLPGSDRRRWRPRDRRVGRRAEGSRRGHPRALRRKQQRQPQRVAAATGHVRLASAKVTNVAASAEVTASTHRVGGSRRR